MKTIEQQLAELEEKIDRIEVSSDEHQAWRSHKVTEKFLLECQYSMMISLDTGTTGEYTTNIEEIAIDALIRRTIKSTYDDVISWVPGFFND